MKRLLVFVLGLFLLSCHTSRLPESVLLKVNFQPGKTYSISTLRGSETVVTYSGEDFAMRKLKSMHVKNPSTSGIRTKTETELSVGKNTSGTCPVELVYKRSMSFDGKNVVPEGTVITGILDSGNMPGFKTVESGNLTIDRRIKLLQALKNTFDQFRFPEKQLKVGDTVSFSLPLSMEIEGSGIETVVTTTCKLIHFDAKTAQFDLAQNYRMTPQMMNNSFSGTGTGTGKMTYDMVNQFISDYSIHTELSMNKKLDYFEFDLKTTGEFSQQVALTGK